MVTLFIMGALIGSGTCLILDLVAQNKVLQDSNRRLEEQNKKYLKDVIEENNS